MTDKTLSQPCPVHAATRQIGGKWKPGILYRLRARSLRFGVLRREMPWISEAVLIRQLKELSADGLVERIDHGEVPPRVDYRLTDLGKSALPAIEAFAAWGTAHQETRQG